MGDEEEKIRAVVTMLMSMTIGKGDAIVNRSRRRVEN